MKKFLEKSKLSRLFSAILFCAAIGFAMLFLWREGPKIPWETFQLNIGFVALSLVISTIGFVPAFLGWRLILNLYHIHNCLQDDLQNYVYSMFGSFVPGGIWQLVGRSMLYKKQEISSLRVTSASILETIFIALAGWLVYWFGFSVRPELSFVKWPGFQYVVIIPILILLEPHVLSWINNWILRRNRSAPLPELIHFSLINILILLFFEILVNVLGGVAVFTLLRSLVSLPISDLINVVTAYSFSMAFASLFFWLPGRMVIKDSAMAIALAQSTPAGMAVIFTVVIRIWLVITVLVPAGLLWLSLTVIQFVQQRRSAA